MIAPVIFCTVVHGIGSMRDLKKVGRVGVKTLFYFEAVSTLALVMGLVVGKLLQPGKGFDIDPTTLDANAVASYVNRAKEEGFVSHLLGVIPETFIGAFTGGDLLQVLLVSILTGFAISRLGELGERINAVIDGMAKVFFGVIQIIVRAAPIGAFGAMAFTVGAFGVGSLVNLIELIATFYLAHPVALDRTRLLPIDHNTDKPAVALATDVDATIRPRQDDRGGSRKGSKGNAVRALCTMPRLPPQL